VEAHLLTSGVDQSDDPPSQADVQYEACKTSIDATMARLAVEQAKLDKEYDKTVSLTQELQKKAKATTTKLIKEAS
jgi:hypothetical protein